MYRPLGGHINDGDWTLPTVTLLTVDIAGIAVDVDDKAECGV